MLARYFFVSCSAVTFGAGKLDRKESWTGRNERERLGLTEKRIKSNGTHLWALQRGLKSKKSCERHICDVGSLAGYSASLELGPMTIFLGKELASVSYPLHYHRNSMRRCN